VGAVLHGHLERLQKGPVVLDRHQLFKTGQEALDETVLLLLRFRFDDVDRDRVVEDHELLALLICQLGERRLLVDLVKRRRQRDLLERLDAC